MKPVIFLKGPRISLCPMSPDYDEFVNVWINDPDIQMYISVRLPQTIDDTRSYRERMTQSNEKNIVLIIVIDDKPIGMISFHNIDYIHRDAELGIYIGDKEEQDKGYGFESEMLMLQYAFHTLNLTRVFASTIAFNKRSYACLEKCGFKKFGSVKKGIYRFGKFWRRELLEVRRKDWEKIWKKFAKKHKIVYPFK